MTLVAVTPSGAAIWMARAVIAGLWLGMAGRVAMRLVAVDAGLTPAQSVGGSVEVVAFGLLVGAPSALVFWAARARWRLPRGAGLAYGLLLFAALAGFPPAAARSALAATSDSPAATAGLFALAFAWYGVVLDMIWQRHLRRLVHPPP